MASKDLILDPAKLDFSKPIADLPEIRRFNPQRYEMEHLTAIVYEDIKKHICVGYKDVGPDEFWVRGHMPGMPIMPGVVMCEAAAQLCSYYTQKHKLLGDDCQMVGFGGLEEVRFRDIVSVGDRLILMCELTKARPGAMCVCRFQGVVGETPVVEGKMKGIPLPVELIKEQQRARAAKASHTV